MDMQPKLTFIFMGVSGSGKSAVASTISKKLDLPFLEGDFLHSRANIDKMAAGYPLNDQDREPWVLALNSAIYAMQHTSDVSILTCSALKQKYRDGLRKNNNGIYFIYLKGSFDLIAMRMKSREGHYFKSDMLKSQFDILEEPMNNHNDIYIIDINKRIETVINNSLSCVLNLINGIKKEQ